VWDVIYNRLFADYGCRIIWFYGSMVIIFYLVDTTYIPSHRNKLAVALLQPPPSPLPFLWPIRKEGDKTQHSLAEYNTMLPLQNSK
jgi:hypothetical protein